MLRYRCTFAIKIIKTHKSLLKFIIYYYGTLGWHNSECIVKNVFKLLCQQMIHHLYHRSFSHRLIFLAMGMDVVFFTISSRHAWVIWSSRTAMSCSHENNAWNVFHESFGLWLLTNGVYRRSQWQAKWDEIRRMPDLHISWIWSPQ